VGNPNMPSEEGRGALDSLPHVLSGTKKGETHKDHFHVASEKRKKGLLYWCRQAGCHFGGVKKRGNRARSKTMNGEGRNVEGPVNPSKKRKREEKTVIACL